MFEEIPEDKTEFSPEENPDKEELRLEVILIRKPPLQLLIAAGVILYPIAENHISVLSITLS